jgi:hypothetical protein
MSASQEMMRMSGAVRAKPGTAVKVVGEEAEEALLDLPGEQPLVVSGEHNRGLLLDVRLRERGTALASWCYGA